MIWLAIIGLAIFTGICFWADWMQQQYLSCPQLILGYGSCKRWRGLPCDHSETAVHNALAAKRDYWDGK